MRLIILSILIFISCSPNTEKSEKGQTIKNVLEHFEVELNQIDKNKIESIDLALKSFKKHRLMANDKSQIDSLFSPFFSIYYNRRGDFFKNSSDVLIKKYGFVKVEKNGRNVLVPATSNYLKDNVLNYLSAPMQEFTAQQLMEFSDDKNLETIGKNTIWWEGFKGDNPDFFLKEMVEYHYKNWHLKNLLNGTKNAKVFNGDSMLINEAKMIYENIAAQYPESGTAKILIEYLALLKENKNKKTPEVELYLKAFESE